MFTFYENLKRSRLKKGNLSPEPTAMQMTRKNQNWGKRWTKICTDYDAITFTGVYGIFYSLCDTSLSNCISREFGNIVKAGKGKE